MGEDEERVSTGERRKVRYVFIKTEAEIQNAFLTCVCSTALLHWKLRIGMFLQRCGRLLMKSADFVRMNLRFR